MQSKGDASTLYSIGLCDFSGHPSATVPLSLVYSNGGGSDMAIGGGGELFITLLSRDEQSDGRLSQ